MNPAYLIANEASGGNVTFRRRTIYGAGWTPDDREAHRWPTLAEARAALDQIEAQLNRAGRRFIVEEIDAGAGQLAHRELAEDEPAAYVVAIGIAGQAPRAYATHNGDHWTWTPTRQAADTMPEADADRIAHDWNEYLATKGSVERCTISAAEPQ